MTNDRRLDGVLGLVLVIVVTTQQALVWFLFLGLLMLIVSGL